MHNIAKRPTVVFVLLVLMMFVIPVMAQGNPAWYADGKGPFYDEMAYLGGTLSCSGYYTDCETVHNETLMWVLDRVDAGYEEEFVGAMAMAMLGIAGDVLSETTFYNPDGGIGKTAIFEFGRRIGDGTTYWAMAGIVDPNSRDLVTAGVLRIGRADVEAILSAAK